MENKRKWNRIVYICMIFILSSGLIFYPAAHTQVYAEEVEGDVGETEESPSSNDSEEKDEKDDSEDKSEDKSKEKEDDKKEESKKESEDKDNDDKEKDESEQSDDEDESDKEEKAKTSENEEEESEEDGDDGGNSGGFIIHSEKVEGEMDMAGALVGKITIETGTIEGLTITKELDTGDERDPMIIKVTSPGPVEVENLKTETLNGMMPDIGDLSLGPPVALKDVTMEVDHQNVEKISLPDASIETCFADECDEM